MSRHSKILNTSTLVLGATFAASMAASSVATAASNPFAMSELHSGYTQLAEGGMEGKCGGNKAQKMEKDKEGKCGGNKAKQMEKDMEGKCGGNKAKPMPKEGKCGGAK